MRRFKWAYRHFYSTWSLILVVMVLRLLFPLSTPVTASVSPGNPWSWGNNNYGELGNVTTTNSSVPVQVNISGVLSIAAGGNHNLTLKSGGVVWAWGDNAYGELGNGSYANSSIPVQVSGLI
jgi:alpha-tubulin suppressor-like RCC1 family protein